MSSPLFNYFRSMKEKSSRSGDRGQLASRIRTERPDPARRLSANLYDIYHCCVYIEKLLMMDRGTV